ncbi:putative ABC transport system permease protein [Clostridium tetanomorphum]|uniref:ABC transporter permease n=1 Tax=Clostridium tetanomorphum TaxID=1553 RepID=UPI00044C148C|nr:ABC transporter [Clostridium tetanomorphum]KAJ52493.1 ABC transporter permease [Clostridium tetanomorphum DSM 665]MBP1864172.1 putative ABC transport system permease protein [Clostridium tetanomorphum]NRS84585.1 putative ABC transport system permease protein [Clostridium tetanomorphum]SQB91915.1 ABC transporter permease [Clostridium tetanomorphum]
MDILINVLEGGMIFSITSLGVYISYKILDFPDLSVDGTFPLGAAITALCLINGMNPFLACILSFIAGALAGGITGLLNVKLKITNLLSGILVMLGLYSINLRIMGKSNIPLFHKSTIFNSSFIPLVTIVVFALLSKILLDLFLNTKLGFLLKAVGDNEELVTSLAVDKDLIKILGLMISNGLVGLSGSIMAQYQGFADVGMGTGVVVMALAAVIIGNSIFKKITLFKATSLTILGAIIYKASIAIALKLGLPPTDLKLITSFIVVITLCINNNKLSIKIKKRSSMGGKAYVNNRKSMESL